MESYFPFHSRSAFFSRLFSRTLELENFHLPINEKKDAIMAIYHPIPTPLLQLFRLTLKLKGKKSNIYSMGESVEDAFKRYLERTIKLKESIEGIEFIQGDLADPHAHLHTSA
jgi:hypothetical protein